MVQVRKWLGLQALKLDKFWVGIPHFYQLQDGVINLPIL